MLECLIHTTDTFYCDPSLKYYDPAIDRASNMKQGYLQIVRPYGFKWGKLELDPKRFLRVTIEDNWFDPAWLEREYDEKGISISDRRIRFPLAKILSLGELESLKNITYNSKTKPSPIIKSVDLRTIAEVNNWDLQPDIIKLHGSAGDFSIQEDGGGDYTSLKTAIETEATSISGGSTDANFYITESWTNAEAGNWDIDGWTMGTNKMLIQAQGDAKSPDGTYTDTAFRIESTGEVIDIENDNTTLDGIQFKTTTSSAHTDPTIKVSSATIDTVIKNCIVNCGTSLGNGITYFYDLGVGTHTVENTVIYKVRDTGEGNSEGILINDPSVTVNIINSVVTGFNDGIERDYGTVTVKNSAVFNNKDDFDGTMTIVNCASDDNTGTTPVDISPGATEATEWAKAFTNYLNDFSIKDVDSVLYDGATNITDQPSTDITGYTWVTDDIGAFAWQTASSPTSLPTTPAPTSAPTTVVTTLSPTTLVTTLAPTTLPPTTLPPTTLSPTTIVTTPSPTTAPPTTLSPTTIVTTLSPTTLVTTLAPTTLEPTLAPTTLVTTLAPTTLPPTIAPTTLVTTLSPTTLITTLAPTTIAPTVPPTTLVPTTLPPTLPPTTLAPTTVGPTLPPTTLGPTTAPISPIVTRRGRSNMGFSMREQWR